MFGSIALGLALIDGKVRIDDKHENFIRRWGRRRASTEPVGSTRSASGIWRKQPDSKPGTRPAFRPGLPMWVRRQR
jgi:hypothetical protein